ncbi:MAG: hypothetical protein QM582_09490 [Micropruina sp.]|uniref:hypothetical protein n=1 Tax=Micropruina sp. TaxID=2737536 RepID=UPI0039E314DC
MTAPSRTQAERALAALANAIRPQWDTRGILSAIRDQAGRPLDELAAGVLYAAIMRTDQHSPDLIRRDGEHWQALDHLTGKVRGAYEPQPTRGCPYHRHQPRDCPDCADHARSVAASRDRVAGHMATIRASIRAARPDHTDDQDQPCRTDPSATQPATNPHPEPASRSTSTANSGPATATESNASSPSAESKSPG